MADGTDPGAAAGERVDVLGPVEGGKVRADGLWKLSERAFERQRAMLFYWQAIAELFYPERADFTASRSPGMERLDDIFDEEPILMRQRLATRLGARMRPTGREWFGLEPADEALKDNDACKRWCERQARTLRNALYDDSANFTVAMRESDDDYVAFGNSVVRLGYNSDETNLLFDCLHLRDCAWWVDRDKKLAGLAERRKIPVGEWPDMFPHAVLPETIARLIKDKPDEERLVRVITVGCNAYEPALADKIRRGPGKAWCSVYIDEQTKTLLGEGYRSGFPYFVRRWMNVSGETYARSPCTAVSLATARTMNGVALYIIEAIEKLVDPTLTAPHDSIVGEMTQRAGDVIYYKLDTNTPTRGPIGTVPTGEPSSALAYSAERREFLARAFYVNLLELPTEHEMTAAESEIRNDQVLADAAPVFEPMEAESAAMLDAAWLLAARKGAFEEAPPELQNQRVKWDIDTPLKLAFKKQKALKAQQLIAHASQFEAVYPDVKDNTDWDKVYREGAEGVAPVEWQLKPEDVAARRQARAQAQAAAQAAELAAKAAGTAPNDAQQIGALGALAAPGGAGPAPGQDAALNG